MEIRLNMFMAAIGKICFHGSTTGITTNSAILHSMDSGIAAVLVLVSFHFGGEGVCDSTGKQDSSLPVECVFAVVVV